MELISSLCWLTACFIPAIAARSVFRFRCLRFADGAFAIYMGLGMALVFAPIWFVCSVTGLAFNSVTVLSGILLFATLSLLVRYKKGNFFIGGDCGTDKDRRTERRAFLCGFILFAMLFLLAAYVKGFKPMIDHQTEQYMDYGFMNAMYRQQKLPFEDIWSANKEINYYYLGQALSVFMCRLSFTSPAFGYNYMLCTVFAALTMSVFSLVQAFLASFCRMKRGIPVFGGAVSALLTSCGGNGHFIVYGIFQQMYRKYVVHDPDYSYWFPTSTLFIGYDPEIADKAKHEFPSYTMVLGDLHAHVCNMLFTIPLLAVLVDHALAEDGDRDGRSVSSHIIIIGMLLGLFKGMNFWDFPIYYVVCGAVILFADLKKYGCRSGTVINVLVKGLIIYITGALLMLPFTLRYISPASGIHLCDRHSPLGKLIIIWFPFLISAGSVLAYLLRRPAEGENDGDKGDDNMIQRLILLAITLCGLGLILVPEIVYVKDIYGDNYERYNTMFKLTFQAFILLSIITGMGTGLLMNEKKKCYRICARVITVLSIMLTAYMPWSVRAWFGNVLKTDLRQGISAAAFIENDPSYDDALAAIRILNEDDRRKVHIIEEAGTSYRPENRLSVFTGAVSVTGWYVHEWVWRNDPKEVMTRSNEVRNFYESGDSFYCRKLAEKYDLDYIYVGRKVREKYAVAYEGFSDLGEKVWEEPENGWMLIRVNK